MTSLAARLQAEADDNAGAVRAREAAEALAAAARAVRLAAGSGDPALLAGALIRLTEATVTVEELLNRQVSASLLLEAGYIQGYSAGQAARGLRAVR